jgi:RNA polymerase sigma-70 factor (ECF subfamily)
MIANIQTPDALLVQDYIAGNEESLSVLIKAWIKIYGFIYSKIADRDTSNDIFQDTFIKVIKTLKSKSYNEEGNFFLGYAIAHNNHWSL